MGLDGKQQSATFEGLDGSEFEVKPCEGFVWDRDATRRMVAGAEEPSEKKLPAGLSVKPIGPKDFVEIDEGVRERFPDLVDEDPDLVDLTGGVDSGERLGGLSDLAMVANNIGVRVDAVGLVGMGKRGGFKRVGVVDRADTSGTVEVDASTFNSQLTLACKIMGVDTKKVSKRAGARKGFEGAAASM